MRLVVFVESFYPEVSGGGFVRWRFCQLAAEKGHDVIVFTPREEGTPREEVVDGVRIIRPLPSTPNSTTGYSTVAVVLRALFSVFLLPYAVWRLYDLDIDAIHATDQALYWVGSTIAAIYRVPYVSFVGYTPSVQRDPELSAKLLLERLNFRFFMGDVAFCRSPDVRNVLKEYSPATVSIIHGNLNEKKIRNAAEAGTLGEYRRKLGVSENDKLIVFVGRLVPIKNPTGAIQVFAELPEEYVLVVVGNGPESDSVKSLVSNLGVSNRVTLLGQQSHQKALTTIAAADALLLSSHNEAYPTVVFEALALNTPVFATPVGILPTITHPHLYLGEETELADRIKDVDPALQYGVNNQILNQYSMERYTKDVLEGIDEV